MHQERSSAERCDCGRCGGFDPDRGSGEQERAEWPDCEAVGRFRYGERFRYAVSRPAKRLLAMRRFYNLRLTLERHVGFS